MQQRYVSIWFPYLKTDWLVRRRPGLATLPLVVYTSRQGRLIISACNKTAARYGISVHMSVADARALAPGLEAVEDDSARFEQVLKQMALWFIRYTPDVAADPPDGLLLNATGCTHLWGGEQAYITEIHTRMKSLNYQCSIAIAGTIGAAWAIARYGTTPAVIETGKEAEALKILPPQSLRLEQQTAERLLRLGIRTNALLMQLSPQALRRRFGPLLLQQLFKALGTLAETIESIVPPSAFRQRLNSNTPIINRKGIEWALQQLMQQLCLQLQEAQQGARSMVFQLLRVDGSSQTLSIGTNRTSSNANHLLHLFEEKLGTITPGAGIELFVLEATHTDVLSQAQEQLWNIQGALQHREVLQLLDRVAVKIGTAAIHRYLAAAHYWPEHAVTKAASLDQSATVPWQHARRRPLTLLSPPQKITVTAPVPDYPPMLFRHNNQLHKIVRAEGPERMEAEWWIKEGEHRDYYYVEDEAGNRYWLFRLGHYNSHQPAEWYLHGYCA